MVAATFFAARTRIDQELAPPSSRSGSNPHLPPYVDPAIKQQEDAAREARNREQQAAADERARVRRESLVARFGDAVAAKIVAKDLWKTKRVFKYLPAGGTRFGLKITLDDDEVAGWDK